MPAPSRRFVMPLRVQARAGSPVEAFHYRRSATRAAASAGGIDPAPAADLLFHGGKLVPQMEFQNLYLGGAAAWSGGDDMALIDAGIAAAMQHRGLENTMAQYFAGQRTSCDARPSLLLEQAPPPNMQEADVQALVTELFDRRRLKRSSLGQCLFNLLLPPGAVLGSGANSSLRGLGGYHGSVHVERNGRRITLYYSANVCSEMLAGGRENGIAVFGKPWKNVVATLYHELNEFRTDPDVNDAIAAADNAFNGWTSRRGLEVGDQPVARAGQLGNLRLVFKEVQDRATRQRIPCSSCIPTLCMAPRARSRGRDRTTSTSGESPEQPGEGQRSGVAGRLRCRARVVFHGAAAASVPISERLSFSSPESLRA